MSSIRWSARAVPAVLALLVVALFATVFPAGAQEAPPLPDNPYERLAEVRRRQAEAAFAVDLLTLSASEVRTRLAEVDAWVRAQQKVVESAQAILVDATIEVERARSKEDAKAAELDALEQLMQEIAIEAFMRPRQIEGLGVLVTRDMDAAAKADIMLRTKNDRDREVADALAAAEAELRKLRKKADEKADEAMAATEAAAAELDELNAARAEQVQLAEKIDKKLAKASKKKQKLQGGEAEALAAVHQETSALLARAKGSATVPIVAVGRGISVHADIAAAVEAMLAEAKQDGIKLNGFGYRPVESQIRLRRQNCGGPDIDDALAVYGVPPGACSPPTALPGTSMHELGLAIDFRHDGVPIETRDSPAFQWLAEHAPGYGLYNLPSEPWHWSVNGL